MTLERISIETDDEGHIYVIPYDLVKLFRLELSIAEESDDYIDFEKLFGQYMIGGCLSQIELYIKK